VNSRRASAVLLMIAVTASLAHAARARGPQQHAELVSLPLQLSTWTGHDAAPLDDETVRLLGADAYLERSYAAGSGPPVDFYIAYYGRQRPGASIHSPLHCLPGTGWEPIDVTTVSLPQADGTVGQLRRLVVRKNMERAVVFYWYAVHGRMIASEILSKAWLLHDGVRFHRSDAALVRIVVPIDGDRVDAAQRQGLAFARDVLPYLPRLWS
jgi:EpsI family protein